MKIKLNYYESLKRKYRTIFYYIGNLTIGIGLLLFTPLFSLLFDYSDVDKIKYFIIPGIMAVLFGYILRTLLEKNEEVQITLREGAIIVTLTWIVAIFFGSLPFWLGRHTLSHSFTVLDSIFETVSGWTTTGLSMVVEKETPRIYLLWRSIMQGVGGAGLIVIMLSAIIGPEGSSLYEAEAREKRLVPNVKSTTRVMLKIYGGYLIVGSLLYWVAGMNLFDSINHSLAALSTGGFSTRNASIGHWNSLSIEIVTYILMILGTTNFATHYALIKGKFKGFIDDIEFKLMSWVFVFFIPLSAYILYQNLYEYLGRSIRVAIFEVISAISTTGFSTVSYDGWLASGGQWSVFIIFLFVLLMLIGGGTSSTAGGIKQYRIALLIKNIYWGIKDKLYPENAVLRHSVSRQGRIQIVDNDHIHQVAGFTVLYLMTFLAGSLVFLLNGYPLVESLFEFGTALGTVGLDIGITGPDMPTSTKVAQILGMWLGRLEFMAIIVAFTRMFTDIKVLRRA
ncbi:MAG: TrkH family potassium uptake protein [Halanaerobiales bacterium]